jgi:hypothetical protein
MVGIFLPGGVTVDFKYLEKDDEIYIAFDGGEWQPPLPVRRVPAAKMLSGVNQIVGSGLSGRYR